jgi:hypothetical protein
LAQEWAVNNIRVNAVAPGWIETPLTEGLMKQPHIRAVIEQRAVLKRAGHPDEIVSVAAFLAMPDRVRYENHYLFTKSGQELVSSNELRFRTRTKLNQSLSEADFSVESVFGDWERRPTDNESPEFIFVAARE